MCCTFSVVARLCALVFFLMIRRPPRSTLDRSSAASDVYKRQDHGNRVGETIQAIDDVSFSVNQGEALGIIGRNGACLLYTSPSPRDRTRSRMPSSA